MRYLPKSPADREAMLKAIGVRSIDGLFFTPFLAEYRLARDLERSLGNGRVGICGLVQAAGPKKTGDGLHRFPRCGTYFHYRPV